VLPASSDGAAAVRIPVHNIQSVVIF
jgi:hypothetical protein